MATNKVQTGLRLEAETLSKITIIAKKSKRSLNNQLEFVVQEFVEKYEKENGVIFSQSES